MADSFDPFDRFTVRARRVLTLAHEEAVRFSHNYIGTEHFLLGLVREEGGVAANVLTNLGVRLPTLRSAVEFIVGRGDPAAAGGISLTPRAKNVIAYAAVESRDLHRHYVDTEHLLLGLVREVDGIAACVLESLGVNLEMMRAQTLRTIEEIDRASTSPLTTRQKLRMQIEVTDGVTQEARDVLDRARQESQRRGNDCIGTEHFLLAMVQMECIAAQVLTHLEIDLKNLQHVMEFLLEQRREGEDDARSLSVRAKKVIDLADIEARRCAHRELSSGHLLLGIVRVRSGLASGMLDLLGVSLESARVEVVLAVG